VGDEEENVEEKSIAASFVALNKKESEEGG